MRKSMWKIIAGSIVAILVGLGIYLVGQLNSKKDFAETDKKTQNKTPKDNFEPYTGSKEKRVTKKNKSKSKKNNSESKKSKASQKKKEKSESEVIVLENIISDKDDELTPKEFKEKKTDQLKEAKKLAEKRNEMKDPGKEKKLKHNKKAAKTSNAPFNPLNQVSIEQLKDMVPPNLDEHPLGGHSLDVNPDNMKEGRKEARPLSPPKSFKKLAEPVKD